VQRDETVTHAGTVFVRDGLVISEVRSRPIRQAVSLVVIDDPAMSAFLGDAENPAHTEWLEQSSHFRGRYINGPAVLRCVRNSAAELWQLLTEMSGGDDADLLLDIFSVGASGRPEARTVSFPGRTTVQGPASDGRRVRVPAVAGRRREIRVTKRSGGFRISGAGTSDQGAGCAIEVVVAYDRRGGSPLRNYSEADFRLDAAPIEMELHGGEIQQIDGNRLTMTTSGKRFELVITGFDANRDLFVRAVRLREQTESRSAKHLPDLSVRRRRR
jgi:hypothetical protein